MMKVMSDQGNMVEPPELDAGTNELLGKANSLREKAEAAAGQGDKEEAQRLIDEAIETARPIANLKHPDVRICMALLAAAPISLKLL